VNKVIIFGFRKMLVPSPVALSSTELVSADIK
jgi:hypothetical protein